MIVPFEVFENELTSRAINCCSATPFTALVLASAQAPLARVDEPLGKPLMVSYWGIAEALKHSSSDS